MLNIRYPIHLIYYLSVYLLFIFSILFFFVATVIFLSFFCFFFIVVKTTAAIFLSEILLLMSSFYLVETAPGNSTTFHYPLRHVQLLIKSWFKVDIRLHLLWLTNCKVFCNVIKSFDLSILPCYIRSVIP